VDFHSQVHCHLQIALKHQVEVRLDRAALAQEDFHLAVLVVPLQLRMILQRAQSLEVSRLVVQRVRIFQHRLALVAVVFRLVVLVRNLQRKRLNS